MNDIVDANKSWILNLNIFIHYTQKKKKNSQNHEE